MAATNCLLILFSLLFCVHSYRILVYSPTISRSHLISNSRIAETLAKAGHDVVLFVPQYERMPETNEITLSKHIRLDFSHNKFEEQIAEYQNVIFSEDRSYLEMFNMLPWYHTLTDMCEEIVMNKEIMNKLREFKFDVAISEQLDLCGVGVSHVLGIKSHIWLSSCPMMEQVSYFAGVPTPLSYVPVSIETDLPDKMTYWQRFQNIIAYQFSLGFHRYGSTLSTKMFQKHFGDDFPDLDFLAGSSPLVFVNSEEFIDFPRPILHKTVYVGGLGLKNAKPLDKKFEELMSIGKMGTVFVSLGSIVQTSAMPKSFKSALFDAFREFPDYCFIFKIDAKDAVSKELAKNVENVKLVEWAPQVDLLGHPNIRAFFTHAGLNSLMEAAYAGVPIVSLGMFGDQTRNGRAAERNGYGFPLSKANLTAEKVATALRTVLENKSYKENAQRISRLMRRKPFQAEERLVQWTEFVAEFKQLPELDVHARNLNFFQYFCLDIFIPVLVVLLLVLYVEFKIMMAICRCCCRRYCLSPHVKTKKE